MNGFLEIERLFFFISVDCIVVKGFGGCLLLINYLLV